MKLFLAVSLLMLGLSGLSSNDTYVNHGDAIKSEIIPEDKVNTLTDALKLPNAFGKKTWDLTMSGSTTVYAKAEVVPVYDIPSLDGYIEKNYYYGESFKVTATASGYDDSGEEFLKLEGDEDLYVQASLVQDSYPENYQLKVENIMQNPELPNGCEITSLTIVMNYEGYPCDKLDMSDNYLPKADSLSADPDEYYLREPRNNGFYCFAGPIVKAVNNFNEDKGTNAIATDLTGSDVSLLYDYVRKGHPLVVWGTLYWNTPYKYESGLYSNLHCMVLSGFTDDTVTITDPIYGVTVISRSRFERVWEAMGSRAVLVENGESEGVN